MALHGEVDDDLAGIAVVEVAPAFAQITDLASSHRRSVPVMAISAASAKLDLPEPLRPMTTVSPGPGRTSRVRRSPIPRKPSTAMARR